MDRFWNKVNTSGNCWEWTASRQRDGYGQFSIGGKIVRAHRYAYQLVYGDPGDKHVCHSCDNPACVNPAHLWLGTAADNTADRGHKGRTHGKLTADDIENIRANRMNLSQRELAKVFGVSQPAIHYVLQ